MFTDIPPEHRRLVAEVQVSPASHSPLLTQLTLLELLEAGELPGGRF